MESTCCTLHICTSCCLNVNHNDSVIIAGVVIGWVTGTCILVPFTRWLVYVNPRLDEHVCWRRTKSALSRLVETCFLKVNWSFFSQGQLTHLLSQGQLKLAFSWSVGPSFLMVSWSLLSQGLLKLVFSGSVKACFPSQGQLKLAFSRSIEAYFLKVSWSFLISIEACFLKVSKSSQGQLKLSQDQLMLAFSRSFEADLSRSFKA